MTHRIGSHSDDWGGDSDLPCDCDTRQNPTPDIDKQIDELYALLKTHPDADTYVIPQRVMRIIASHISTAVREARETEVKQAMFYMADALVMHKTPTRVVARLGSSLSLMEKRLAQLKEDK